MSDIELKNSYWASVSGGKDSLYMFRLILDNPKKYPLNGVVHFDLEIDYPWVKEVINQYKEWCKKLDIPFIKIKPRKSWFELEEKYYFPLRVARWCNNLYKLDCKKQFLEQYKNIVNIKWYIGLCANEKNRIKDDDTTIYPLVNENIEEEYILQWAQNVPIFNNYYKTCKRQGCMWCPNSTMIEKAYLKKYYPDEYQEMIKYIRRYENKFGKPVYHKFIDEIDVIINNKWLERVK